MNSGAYYLAALLIPLIVPLILLFLGTQASKNTENPNVMKYSRCFAIIGIVGDAFFVAIYILGLFQNNNYPLYTEIIIFIMFIIIIILGLICVFIGLNKKIVLNEDNFVYVNLLGIKKIYQYFEISSIYINYAKNTKIPEKYTIYIGRKKITADYLMSNFWTFEELIKKRLRKANNKIKIEVASKKHK